LNLSLFIAKRYFFSKKKKNFINIISFISMLAVAVGTMALVIVLAVFNGLEDLIRSLHKSFDAELMIKPSKGKSFELTDSLMQKINTTPGVAIITEVIEDNAYVSYNEAQMVIRLKGVSDNFTERHRMEPNIVQGSFKLKEGSVNYAVLGRGVQWALSAINLNAKYPLKFYYTRRLKSSSLNPMQSVNKAMAMPAGVFSIEKQYDTRYVFVPIRLAQELLEYENRRTSLELGVSKGYTISEVQSELKNVLGNDFEVLNEEEQHASLLKAIKIEKLFVFITLSFIIAISSFNIFFSLTMLAIEKKRDIAVLGAMGASRALIRKIFMMEGGVIAFTGAIAGLVLGLIVCLLQMQFGFISMGMETAVMQSYPVKIIWSDLVLITLAILLITFLASFRPAVIASKVSIHEQL
jgi:lipoprotein-releasing system permease protein